MVFFYFFFITIYTIRKSDLTAKWHTRHKTDTNEKRTVRGRYWVSEKGWESCAKNTTGGRWRTSATDARRLSNGPAASVASREKNQRETGVENSATAFRLHNPFFLPRSVFVITVHPNQSRFFGDDRELRLDFTLYLRIILMNLISIKYRYVQTTILYTNKYKYFYNVAKHLQIL